MLVVTYFISPDTLVPNICKTRSRLVANQSLLVSIASRTGRQNKQMVRKREEAAETGMV